MAGSVFVGGRSFGRARTTGVVFAIATVLASLVATGADVGAASAAPFAPVAQAAPVAPAAPVAEAVPVAPAAPAQGVPSNTIVVDSNDDRADVDVADGVCRTAAGTCSLRAAIAEANWRPGPNTITFAIPGNGVHTITAATPLPDIADTTGPITIDGYTQPGATANTAATGSNANLRVQVAGPADGVLININSPANVIRGLALYAARVVVNIEREAADGNRIVGNFLGTNAAGTYENPIQVSGADTGVGVLIVLGADQNVIGTPALADRNVISGNGGYAIRINHGESAENLIQNNVIGLNPSLTAKLRQWHGIDLQYWTWGNLIGGYGEREGNLVGGQTNRAGIELSHAATNNLVIGNYVGTLGDGNSAAAHSANTYGIALKDFPTLNYIADNVVAGNAGYGIWHKHNYTGENTFVNNRIGVGSEGAFLPNQDGGTNLTGHNQIWYGNLFGESRNHVYLNNYIANRAPFYFPTYTQRNRILQSQFHNGGAAQSGPYIDITPVGDNANDPGDGDSGVHDLANSPEITGIGPGKIFGQSCAGCTVEVYVSGSLLADGTLDTSGSATGTGLAWIGTVTASNSGEFSLGDPRIAAGRRASALSIDLLGNTSELPSGAVVPNSHRGRNGVAGPSQGAAPEPPRPALPRPYSYQDRTFECSYRNGVLSWDDAGATEYYVFGTTGGVERYLGGHRTTSITTSAADSYRVEHWLTGRAWNALCEGPAPAGFDCSQTNGVLSWDDAGANEYYVFATTGADERYLGGHSTTSLNVAPANSYRVEHWLTGSLVEAICDGPGVDAFSCSVSGSTLTWSDVGAGEYYVFATSGGVERYLGGHSTTSLNVAAADSYRVEHWLTGQATNALCS